MFKSFLKLIRSSKLGLIHIRKSLRREGDSNPRNPFGVYTLSRRASSTTRASLLRRNWLARRNSPCEFGLPPLLLLTRAHEALVIFSRLSLYAYHNWLARRNSPCEFGLPPLLLLTRAHNAPQKSEDFSGTPPSPRYLFHDYRYALATIGLSQ